MSSFFTLCHYTFKLHVRCILKLTKGWIARDEEGTGCTKQDSEPLKCRIRWGPMWRRVFTRNCRCVINSHAEQASIQELVRHMLTTLITSCESLLVLQWLNSCPVFRRFWVWVLVLKPASLPESICSLQENKPGRSFNHATEKKSWNQPWI